MNNYALRVTGMTCEHCASAVQTALRRIAGVRSAAVSFSDQSARVEADTALDADQLIRTIQARGYKAELTGDGAGPKTGTGAGLKIVIIGGGSAAFAAAIRATEEGASVSMIESGTLGGTCVNVGCLPSKIMIRAAQVAHQQAYHPFDGLGKQAPRVNRAVLVAQQQARVEELRQAKYADILEANPSINLVRGRARFVDANTVEVARHDGKTRRLSADRFLIATGRSPNISDTPGFAGTPYWTSTEALIEEQLPRHLIVQGASAVAVELAQAFLRLGSKVTLLARSTLLSKDEPAIGAGLQAALESEGMRILTHTTIKHVRHDVMSFQVNVCN